VKKKKHSRLETHS